MFDDLMDEHELLDEVADMWGQVLDNDGGGTVGDTLDQMRHWLDGDSWDEIAADNAAAEEYFLHEFDEDGEVWNAAESVGIEYLAELGIEDEADLAEAMVDNLVDGAMGDFSDPDWFTAEIP